jgi:hypothetical protein
MSRVCRTIVTQGRWSTTPCHDIFGYYFRNLLIFRVESGEEIGRTDAIKSILVNR